MGTLFEDGRNRGQVQVLLDETGNNVRIDGEGLMKLLRPRLDEATQDLLASKLAATGGRLGLADLRDIGLEARFDSAALALHVNVPANLRGKGTHRLQDGYEPKDFDDALAPSAVSGFLNLRAGMGFVEWDENGPPRRDPVRGAAEAAINVMGWVLESEARYAEDHTAPVALQGVRVVKDLPDKMLRFTLGDLVPVYRGQLQGRPMGGFSVVRNFALQPYRTTHPVSRYEFFLQRPSLVHVWIGERLAQTLRLEAGPHDLRDLPLSSGLTDVRLQVIDDVGHEEILTFDAISYQELLAPGLQQFAYSIGFPSIEDGAIRDYSWENPMLLAFHRVGVLDNLTLGGYLQANLDSAVVGVEGLWANRAGLWGLDVAAGSVTSIAKDYAVSLRYRNMPTTNTMRRGQVWSASLEAAGSEFSHPGSDYRRPYHMGLSANYGQTLFWRIHGSLGATYRLSGANPHHAYSVDLSLRRQLWKGTHLSLVGSQRGDSDGESIQRVTVNFIWHLPGRHTITDSFDSEALSNRLTWNYGSPGNSQNLRAWFDATQRPDRADLQTGAAYTGQRGEVRLSQAFDMPDLRLSGDLTVGTALVFAGNVFGISRPVSDSFALIKREGTLLRDLPILVNPRDELADARADYMGPGVLGNLPPYRVSRMKLEVPNLPFGYDIGPTHHALLPTYRSGFAFRIGVTTTVFVIGTLLDASGEPVRLRAGEVIALDDSQAPPIAMFTNRGGRFALDRMNPGRYAIRLEGDERTEVRFEVPEDFVGRFDAGLLVLPPTQASGRLHHNARLRHQN